MSFRDAFNKFKDQKNKAVKKLPKPFRQKADDKLGLFLHKYISTLLIFDDEIQEIYQEMEEAVQKGNRQEASRLSEEMKTVILMKTNKQNGCYSRRHEKRINKAADRITTATETIKDMESISHLKKFLKIKDQDPEEIDLSEDMEEMVKEVRSE